MGRNVEGGVHFFVGACVFLMLKLFENIFLNVNTL